MVVGEFQRKSSFPTNAGAQSAPLRVCAEAHQPSPPSVEGGGPRSGGGRVSKEKFLSHERGCTECPPTSLCETQQSLPCVRGSPKRAQSSFGGSRKGRWRACEPEGLFQRQSNFPLKPAGAPPAPIQAFIIKIINRKEHK